ncbi:MAG: ribosome biogenesis GTP-binding protein YsxC [Candidatus Muiribacterium halophilum]|uniref:Probable GTP-binding protein EngB n=1 Tax=Muiribacterium halophilum TaxID=2053465 RepID=A0A2N5ZBE3_MUIH1|nr:MAG: ribosome biogenesis GTP-binding protein YsxC [Candidatus Muirbacterium halophilum]
MKVNKIEFNMMGKYEKKDDLSEFAFVGRSNAGKSSIINTLTNKKINRVSKKPGCTRCINTIKINDKFYIVDLPGAGFAKVSLKEKKRFNKITEQYLEESEHLRTVFLIMDIKVAPTNIDIMMIEWLKSIHRNFVLILNKVDNIPKNKLQQRKKEIFKKLGFKYPSITVSATKKINITELEKFILSMV